ncbi:MAG TPA: MerR family transcriptional regulator [Gaiellaceae bacterium]|nr:MerR family transcriptional regulator [Gaiellaceae bacterium]
MTAVAGDRVYRIGEVAERVGVTPRTIRYYEELGLIRGSAEHVKGTHRLYTEADVTRLTELIRLRNLLGVSLEELTMLAETEEARAELRDQWAHTEDAAERRRIVESAIPHVERQLALVRSRQETLAELEAELAAKREHLNARLNELR